MTSTVYVVINFEADVIADGNTFHISHCEIQKSALLVARIAVLPVFDS